MSIEKLKKELKEKNFQRFYLLFGEEYYLIRYYKNALVDAILDGKENMNFSAFSGKNINFSEVASLANTLPFFSEYRVILIENASIFSSANELAEDLSDIPASTVLIFVEESADKRTKLYKFLSKNGLCVEFPREKPENLSKWILSVCKKNQILITKADADYLLYRVGNSMDMLYQEMEKLISFVHEKGKIEREDIEIVCPETLQDKIFKLMDCIGKKDRTAALRYYYDLFELREPMLKILSLITRHFHILLVVKKLQAEGRQGELPTVLKLPPFVISNYLRDAGNFSLAVLTEALEYAATLDYEIKRGKILDKIAIENLILTYTK